MSRTINKKKIVESDPGSAIVPVYHRGCQGEVDQPAIGPGRVIKKLREPGY